MSDAEKKFVETLEKLEKTAEKKVKIIREKTQYKNLFPLMAGGVAVFLLMVSMVVVAPYMFLLDIPPSDTAHVYTTQEAEGRNLFMTMGCFYCHSQQVRASDWGIGNISQEGDYVYDSPNALGTERTGPDLAQIGGMRPTIWHQMHDRDPRSVSPGSLMPNFGFLTDEQIDALTAYIQNLGQENLQVETSITDGSSFHPAVPDEYVNATNQFTPMLMTALAQYDVENDAYNGNATFGDQWAVLFDAGKADYTQFCLSCHGCSGNAEGPYARHVATQPANLHERIATFPGDSYDIWRVSGGVPGTAMPAWSLSLNDTEIRLLAAYELSFVFGSARTFSGDLSDAEGDTFAQTVLNSPPIAGTQQDFQSGQSIFNLYCAQCHGEDGQGDGPASSKTPGGYIIPEPANFTESGGDFIYYGRYVWKVQQGVETTNMPPWKYVMTDNEVYQLVFYVQSFSTADDYNTKWAPQYTDPFAMNLKVNHATAGFFSNLETNPVGALVAFMAVLLWDRDFGELRKIYQNVKIQPLIKMLNFWRLILWI
jgi:cytochrome c oxidase cbb3-type subunit I/II